MNNENTREVSRNQLDIPIDAAIQTLFSYLDMRLSAGEEPSMAVVKAFHLIVKYYTPRLANCVQVQSVRRVVDPDDLYAHAWTMLWMRGKNIQCRSAAGVYAWLKRVVYNRRSQLVAKYAQKLQLTVSFDQPDGGVDGETKKDVMMSLGIASEHGAIGDVVDRFDQLAEYYVNALAKLPVRQQTIIRLGREKYSPAEIMRLMEFTSIDATKSFKRRAYRALSKQLYLLFRIALKDPALELQKKAIIEEWLERYCRNFDRDREKARSRHFA